MNLLPTANLGVLEKCVLCIDKKIDNTHATDLGALMTPSGSTGAAIILFIFRRTPVWPYQLHDSPELRRGRWRGRSKCVQ